MHRAGTGKFRRLSVSYGVTVVEKPSPETRRAATSGVYGDKNDPVGAVLGAITVEIWPFALGLVCTGPMLTKCAG